MFGDLPSEPPPSDPLDFGAPPAASGADPFGAAPAGPAMDDPFGAAPSQDPGLGADPFGAAPDGGDPFGAAAPAPAAPPEPAFAMPPPPAAAPGFGELDLGGGAPPPAQAPAAQGAGDLDFMGFDPSAATAAAPAPARPKGEDSLEFNPLSSKEAPGGDDLEADLGAPLPGGAPRVEAPRTGDNDLELLDFIDEAGAGKDAGKKLRPGSMRYQIRRKSGKVFGPFEQPAVVKMLAEGQLLGNEDVTTDGESWVAIGSVQAFGEAIQKLMEGPGGMPGLSAGPIAETSTPGSSGASAEQALERMKALYGDRMASIAIVDSAAAEQKFMKRLPLIIVAAVVVAVLGVGLYLGTTPYGLFGVRYLFKTHLKQGTAAWAKFIGAQNALKEDNFESYQRALTDAESLLAEKESAIESRALFVEATFYLKRRFFTGDEKLGRANAYLKELELASKDDPEVVKARAGLLLLKGEGEKIRQALEAASAKNKGDPEFLYLLAESYVRERHTGPAAEALKRVLATEPHSAKALHGLGVLKTLEKSPDFQGALEFYQKALEADPRHLTSAVEIAAIELQKLDEPEKAADFLRKSLTDEAKKVLAPADQARAHYLMGMLHAARHQRDDAVKEFEEALKIHPDSAPAHAAYGRYLLHRHDPDKALQLFEAAYKSDNKEIDYLDGYVRALLGASKLGPASKLVGEAGGSFPGNPRIALLAGLVADDAEKGDDAERSYKRAAQGDPKLWEASLRLGRFYLRRKRLEDARLAFEDALKRAPNNQETHVGLGNYLLVAGKLAEAKAEFLAALKVDAESPGGHFGFAQVLVSEGATDDARKEYETVIQIDPYVAQLYTQYGALLWQLKDLPAATKSLEKAKNADPKDATATWKLGAVYFEQGNMNEATKNIESALSVDGASADAWFWKARIHYERRENNQGIESIKRALEFSSTRAEFHHWRGNIMYQAGKFDDAVESWQQAVKLRPDYADALEALGRGYQERGDPGNAIGYFEKAQQVDPARQRLLINVADCLYNQNQPDKAVAKYLEALKKDHSQVSAYGKIGKCYNDKGRIDEAIKYWLLATEKDPEAREVWRFLGYAYKEKRKKDPAINAFHKYIDKCPDCGDLKEIQLEINDLETER